MPVDITKNTITLRVRLTSEFKKDSFFSKILDEKKGITARFGILKTTNKSAVHSFIFDKDKGWTLDKAKKWVKDKGYETK